MAAARALNAVRSHCSFFATFVLTYYNEEYLQYPQIGDLIIYTKYIYMYKYNIMFTVTGVIRPCVLLWMLLKRLRKNLKTHHGGLA